MTSHPSTAGAQLAAASISVLGASPRGGSPGSLSPRPASPRLASPCEPASPSHAQRPAVEAPTGVSPDTRDEEDAPPALQHEVSFTPRRSPADSPAASSDQPISSTAIPPSTPAATPGPMSSEGLSFVPAATPAVLPAPLASSPETVAVGVQRSDAAAPEGAATFSAFAAAQAQRTAVGTVSLSDTMFASAASIIARASDAAAEAPAPPQPEPSTPAYEGSSVLMARGRPQGGGVGGDDLEDASIAAPRGMPPRESMLSATDLVEHGQRAAAAEVESEAGAEAASESAPVGSEPEAPASAAASRPARGVADSFAAPEASQPSALEISSAPQPTAFEENEPPLAAPNQPRATEVEQLGAGPTSASDDATIAESAQHTAAGHHPGATTPGAASDSQTRPSTSVQPQGAQAPQPTAPTAETQSNTAGAEGDSMMNAPHDGSRHQPGSQELEASAATSEHTSKEPIGPATTTAPSATPVIAEGPELAAQGSSEPVAGQGARQLVSSGAAVEPAAPQAEPAAAKSAATDDVGTQSGVLEPHAELTLVAVQPGSSEASAAAVPGGSRAMPGAAEATYSEGDVMLDAQSQRSDGSTISI